MATLEERRAAFWQKLRSKQTTGGLRADLFRPAAPTLRDVAGTINRVDRTARAGMLPSLKDVAPLHGDRSQQPVGEYRLPGRVNAPAPQAPPVPPVSSTARQTSFTNADIPNAAPTGGLRSLPGRETNPYSGSFVDRLKRFQANNPEFTPRSQKANKGLTVIGDAWKADRAAAMRRREKDRFRDALLSQGKTRGSYNRQTLAALTALDAKDSAGSAAPGRSASPGESGKARGGASVRDMLTARGQDLSAAQAQQRLGLDQLRLKSDMRSKSNADSRAQREALMKERNNVFENRFGPAYVKGEDGDLIENKRRTGAERFADYSGISDPKVIGDIANLYEQGPGLAKAEAISKSWWPWLARAIPLFRAGAKLPENDADAELMVRNLIQGGKDASGNLKLDPQDMSQSGLRRAEIIYGR